MTIAEQPEDWTEPGAHPVRPGVHRVPLPLPSNGLHAVNAYVIESPEGPVVVDSGWAMPDTEKALAQALGTLGHRLADVAHILVTHAHWDHYSQALRLRETFGTRVRIGRGEQPSIDAFDEEQGFYPRQIELLRRCGAPEIAGRVAATESYEYERDLPRKQPDGWLDDGQRISLGPVELDVFATPGHTRGHVVLRDATAGLLFAGDHVLPHITPSLGLETVPDPRPLRSYLDSLRLVRGMPDTLLLPAHGPVTLSVHTRVEELLAHHEERLDACAHEIKAGARTAYEVAVAMPWTRRRRRLDDLDLFSQMLAVLETGAHLDVLADQGVLVAADLDDGVRAYAPS
ncbi:MBL fold metallo-hydrolase [Streptosporangium sp. NBC_01755]|uniref:MBL fold metallo-hydrolase n=1 Tax=Streptosporangium sp. NBC_01755 TaxID=2975949 RepID=UPI002DD9F147|nr:MBL fold metallo-hydrolase [Streptosporangium sp. NBC_01755]WSC99564.1 MBL fold metallo-hydrolase [Streptosporangium sp. NBC_01755]